MRLKTVYHQKTIRATSPEEYDRQMNEALSSLREVQIIDRLNDREFCSIVRFKESVEVPETVAEEYRVNGYKDTCSMCKNFVPSTDGRTKYVHCPHDNECKAWPERFCCDYYWAMMKNGLSQRKENACLESQK